MKAVFRAGPAAPKSPFERYLVTHPMGDIIFSEGEIGTEMYIVQSGTVELLKEIGGSTRVLSTLEKGDFFGEMSVLEDLPRTASARAKTDVELVRINGATFDAMLKSNTEIAVRMMRKLSRRQRELTGMLEEALDLAPLDPQRSTSRRHAKIYPMGGKLYLMEEIGVMNGTFVNGSRVATGTPVPVAGGDELRFGLVPLTLETAAGT